MKVLGHRDHHLSEIYEEVGLHGFVEERASRNCTLTWKDRTLDLLLTKWNVCQVKRFHWVIHDLWLYVVKSHNLQL